jgi:hypothetical protein
MRFVVKPFQRRNWYPKNPFGAAHRVYLDTPPLVGRCRALAALVGAVMKSQDLQD